VSDDADAGLGEIEQRQREILAELNRSGRKVDDLAAMFGLAVKRVRTLLRQARPPAGAAATAAAPQARAANDTAQQAPTADAGDTPAPDAADQTPA
jgi:hypothetical protein